MLVAVGIDQLLQRCMTLYQDFLIKTQVEYGIDLCYPFCFRFAAPIGKEYEWYIVLLKLLE